MKRLFLVACGLLLTVSMFAQTTKGEINGTVFDESGTALPGVTVVVSSAKLQGTRTTVTNAKGFYRFPLLPLGYYTATYSIPGFTTYTKKGIGVKVGEKTKVPITLKAAKLSESIVVTAEAPLVDASTTDSSVEMGAKHLDSIPTLSRSVEDVAKFVPGVTGVRMDSVTGGEGGIPNIRGAGQEGNQYMVDGTSVRSSMGFDNNVAQNFDSIDSLQVISDPFSPEFGKTMGGAINAVTKSGGNEFHGEAGFQYRNSSLEATRQHVQNDSSVTGFSRNKQWYNVGGYIIKDKLWFFVSYNYTKSTNDSAGADPRIIHAEDLVNMDGTPFGSDYTVYNFPDGTSETTLEKYFYKFTYNITENMNVAFSGLDIESTTDNKTGVVDLYGHATNHAYRYKINFNWIVGDWGSLEARYGTQHQNFTNGGLTDTNVAMRNNTTIAWTYANRSRYDVQVQDRDDYAVKWTGYVDTASLGSHEYTVGWSYQDFSTNWLLGQTGAGEWVDVDDGSSRFTDGVDFGFQYMTNDAGQIIMGANGQPISIPTTLTERRDSLNPNTVHSTGYFLQDRITMGKWVVMLGWRFDDMTVFDDTGQEIWDWGFSDYSAPRLSVIYDLTGEQKHIFKFAYGQFFDATTTRIAEFFNREGGNAYRQYGWVGPTDHTATEAEIHNPANWEFTWEQSPETAPMDYDPALKPEHQNRWLVEYDWRINANHAMTLRYTKAISHDLIDDIGVMVPDGYAFFLTNFEYKRRDYESIDLIFKGNFGEWMDYYFNYTWTDSKGTNPGNFENETLNNPGGSGNYIGVFGDHIATDGTGLGDFLDWLLTGLGGRGIGDEGWYGKLSDSTDNAINFVGNFHLPYDFNITTAVQWNSGYFWAKKGYQPAYDGYFTFPEGRGSRKTSSLLWVDVTVTKDFKVWYDHTLQLRLDVFNLLNSQQPISFVEEDTVDFGTPYSRQAPRAIQLGISYKF